MGADLVLHTRRLDLCTVLPSECLLLAVDRADPRLWVDRGFANPHRHLVDDPGPLPFRLPRIAADPAAAPYLLRMAVLREERAIIGSAGFHLLPDSAGMIEIGLGVEEPFRGQGLAQEMLHGMWRWVIDQPGVTTLRYTVARDNAPSQAIIRAIGGEHMGVQVDEIDGPEDIFEVSAGDYRARFCAT